MTRIDQAGLNSPIGGRGTVRAILGPTNTGKTFLAMDRMLAYPTGIIGFPLRLLARENYDKVVAQHGVSSVALITGEEKIIPPNPRWWICTVESMPLDRLVEFVAVDEIQLCADPDRGHIFTDRLMNARGRSETMFMGSDTMAGLIRQLVPDVLIESRPRFSTLRYTGQSKLTRLPRRSAIVAFSVDEVYGIAELVRRQRGGTAVVLGALSPRTRNAQVAMYQAGEVDYLVATDAIGMGLNMDVNHVAFARLRKFDGHRIRPLDAPEVGQIAGRAGRHLNDGTFGVTNNQSPPSDEIVAAVEAHQYQPLTKIFWRSRALDFRSATTLMKSLQRHPPSEQLIRVRNGEDQAALAALIRDETVLDRAQTRDRVHLLWDVCQIPDFRQMTPDHHADLLGQIFMRLTDGDGLLSRDWLTQQFQRLDRTDADIDTITNRIAHIRTLAYIAHRGAWLADATGWQDRAREIEDRLSDALHERLIHRFVDKRASMLTRGDIAAADLMAGVRRNGEVVVEGHVIGHLEAFRFIPHQAADAREAQALMAAAEKVLRDYTAEYVGTFEEAENQIITLEQGRTICWAGKPVARLEKGASPWQPRLHVLQGFVQDQTCVQRIENRLNAWLNWHIDRRLGPLLALQKGGFSGAAKGLCYQLLEGLGCCTLEASQAQVRKLTAEDRKTLSASQVRFGTETVYVHTLLKPQALKTRAALWSAWMGLAIPEDVNGKSLTISLSTSDDEKYSHKDWLMLGYRCAGRHALRADRYEHLLATLRRQARADGIVPNASLAKLAGCETEALPDMLRSLGCSPVKGSEGTLFRIRNTKKSAARGAKRTGSKSNAKQKDKKDPRVGKPNPDSPFAALKGLIAAP